MDLFFDENRTIGQWLWVAKTGSTFGNQQAGPRIAAILFIVESCRRLQVPIRDYLASILPDLDDLPIRRVAELTPTAWSARP